MNTDVPKHGKTIQENVNGVEANSTLMRNTKNSVVNHAKRLIMDRKELIDTIKFLFPPDNHETGKELLMIAICRQWESLPIEILRELASLCRQRDRSY